MKLENQRNETPFSVRDNMLDIWNHLTELCMRGFGKKKRKMPKTPRNFDKWSEKSRSDWTAKEQARLEQVERFDMTFIQNETRVIDDLCRQIVYKIDRANSINPQYLFEYDYRRLIQDEAIGLCNNLKRELNHVAQVLPSNINFLVKQTEDIEKEIMLIQRWRKSQNDDRKDLLEKEIARRKCAAEKVGFIIAEDEINDILSILKTM